MTKISKNPASPEVDSNNMLILPPMKMDTMLNSSHSTRLPMPNLARRSLKSDFFAMFLLSIIKKTPECLVRKLRGIKLAAD